MKSDWRSAMLLSFVMIAALIVGPAFAQDAKSMSTGDQKKAAELQEREQRIDAEASKTATAEGQKRVATTLAKEFKVPETTVTDLREQKKLGWGGVAITLSLAEALAKRDHLSMNAAIDQVIAKRQSGEGWGQIAHDLNLKLGRVVSDVHRAEKDVASVERAERKADRAERIDKNDRPEKAEKADRPDRPEKMDRPDRPEKVDRPDRPEKMDRPERPERAERSGRR